MMPDSLNSLADDLSAGGAVAQAFSGSITVGNWSFDTLTAASDPSIGRRMCVAFYPTVNTAVTSIQLDVVQDSVAALSSYTSLASTVVLTANVVVGKPIVIDIPPGTVTKRYLGMALTVTGGGGTSGFAYLMPSDEVPHYKDFPKVVNANV